VVVLSAARSAVGTFGGSLSDMEPSELAGIVMKETIRRSGADPKLINYVTVGNTIPTESRSAYVARVASIQAGLPMESVAMAVNRLCSSGLQAIVTTGQNILLGDCDFGIGGGVEVMSRGAYISTAMRSGARMGDTKLIDMMVATLNDPFGAGHMGIAAENLATKWVISREEQDTFSIASPRGSRDKGRPLQIADRACGQENQEGRSCRRHRRACEARHDS
jgi:acetyl-CoA C-acetyltransferase